MVFFRGSGAVGTNGIGYVALAPTPYNGPYTIFHSDATYAGTAFSSMGTGGSGHVHNSLTTALAGYSELVGRTAFARVVSAGLRVTYTGTKLNESGLFYGIVHPEHRSIASMTPAACASINSTIVKRVADGGSIELSAFGQREEEMNYPTTEDIEGDYYPPYPFCSTRLATTYSAGSDGWTANRDIGAPMMGVLLSGCVAGSSFYYEVVYHCEFIGSKFSGRTSITHNDFAGYQTVNMAASSLQSKRAALPRESSKSIMVNSLTEAAKAVAPVAISSAFAGGKYEAIATAALAML